MFFFSDLKLKQKKIKYLQAISFGFEKRKIYMGYEMTLIGLLFKNFVAEFQKCL